MLIDEKPIKILETPYKKVTYLRTKNEKLTEEVTEQARLLGISAEKELALMAKMDQLKKELATAQEHIRDLEDVRQNDIDEFNILSEQLTAALAACEKKGEALDAIIPLAISDCQQWSSADPETDPYIVQAREALAIQPDASALNDYRNQVIEECAKEVEAKGPKDGNLALITFGFSNTLRGLKK